MTEKCTVCRGIGHRTAMDATGRGAFNETCIYCNGTGTAARATPADQKPVLGKDVWEYSFVHSSALGRPDEKVTMLTYEKENAFKPECFDQKLVCSVGMFVAEVSQDSDGFKHIADVVELDDIPAGTKLYAITAGNLFTVPQPEAQSVRDAFEAWAMEFYGCARDHVDHFAGVDGYVIWQASRERAK